MSVDIATVGPRSRAHRIKRARNGASFIVLPLVAVVVLVAIWTLISHFTNPLLLATPLAVAKAMANILTHGNTISALLLSIREMYIGLAIGVTAGFLLGVFIGRFQAVNNVLGPFVNVINATPLIVAIPLIVIWTGVGVEARIVFTLVVTTFPMLLNTAAGVRNTHKGYIEVASTLGLSERATMWKVAIPAATPYILAGMRSSLSLAIIGMVVGEMEVSNVGVGWLLLQYGAGLQTAFLLGLIAITSLFGVVNVTILKIVERTVFKWTVSTR
ncbi:MAG TPA: ABC transporter permease [Acidimicrobiales bacterium]|nr:ABC transporter permease [Acidimicrobiales bacterium]